MCYYYCVWSSIHNSWKIHSIFITFYRQSYRLMFFNAYLSIFYKHPVKTLNSIFIYTNTDGQLDRQTDKHTNSIITTNLLSILYLINQCSQCNAYLIIFYKNPVNTLNLIFVVIEAPTWSIKIRLPPLKVHFRVGGWGQNELVGGWPRIRWREESIVDLPP